MSPKRTRTTLRATHLVLGFLVGLYVYSPLNDSDAMGIVMQLVVAPAILITGLLMWQGHRLRKRRQPVAPAS
jgi:hypothetical protein